MQHFFFELLKKGWYIANTKKILSCLVPLLTNVGSRVGALFFILAVSKNILTLIVSNAARIGNYLPKAGNDVTLFGIYLTKAGNDVTLFGKGLAEV